MNSNITKFEDVLFIPLKFEGIKVGWNAKFFQK